MSRRLTIPCSLLILAAWYSPAPLLAQRAAQSVPLVQGWNSIYLEVEPEETSCAALVSTFPQIESIWSYDNQFGGERAFDPTEFGDPGMEPPPVRVQKRWRVFHPSYPEATDLHHLHGSRAYLLRVKDDSAPWSWNVTGVPALTRHHWVPNDYTLTGFPIDRSLGEGSRPTFAAYFAGSPVHLDPASQVYELTAPGQLAGPLNKQTARIQPGRAYFVHTAGASSYRGVIEVGAPAFQGLDFGQDAIEEELELGNTRDAAVAVTLRLIPALAASDNAGVPVLQFFDSVDRQWKPLAAQGLEVEVPAAARKRLRLQARRQGLAPAVRGGGGAAAAAGAGGGGGADPEPASGCYQGVIEVAGAAGTVTSVPVCLEVGDYTGLWVGQVDLRYVRLLRRGAAPRDASGRGVIDPATGKYQVGSFTIPQDFPDAARDAAPELSFPLVIHVGPASQLKLLHQVAVMWKNGVPDNPQTVPSELVPGRYVIVTGDGLRAGLVESLGLVGGTLRDGRQFSFRKTAPTFPDNYDLTPEAGAGEFEGTGRFSTAIELSALHPLNPFLHRYHPDHGHPKVMRSTGNVPARGGLDVKRSVWLTFDRDTDPRTQGEVVVEGVTYQDQAQPGYGDQVIGGTYREVIESITYDPVIVEGSFRLYRSVRSVKVLNDGAPVE